MVRSISRNIKTWDDFKKVNFELSEDFLATLYSKEETIAVELAAKKAHKFNSDIDNSLQIFNLGVEYWYKIYLELLPTEILSYGDCSFIKSIGDYIKRNKLPTPAQCKN